MDKNPRELSFKSIRDRIAYLEKQVAWYKSTNEVVKASTYLDVINELAYWAEIYEPFIPDVNFASLKNTLHND